MAGYWTGDWETAYRGMKEGEMDEAIGADVAWDEEGETAADLEGELSDDDEREDDMSYLTGEIRALEGELGELRRRYRRTLPALDARAAATRHEAGRRLAALVREGEGIGWTICHLANEHRERFREDAAD